MTQGDFAAALRAAIATSGLGLEQLQRRLHRQGAEVSLAALSYWRSGRSVPSRQSSLDAVGALERILELAPGSLAALLPASTVSARGDDEVDPELRALAPLVPAGLARLMTRTQAEVELVSDHLDVVVGPDRCCTSARSRRVYRAHADGVDRVLVATSVADGPPIGSGLVALSHGRPAERAVVGAPAVALTELVLDRSLRRGEVIMVELELDRSASPASATPVELAGPPTRRELVVEVQFDPRALPSHCSYVEGAGEAVGSPVAVNPNATALVVRHDVRARRPRLCWEWPSDRR